MNKPLLLRPSGKDYLWGGQRLNTEFEKGIESFNVVEFFMLLNIGSKTRNTAY